MTQTKKSGGVNAQGDTMENTVMVSSGEGLFPYILLYTAAPSPPPRRFFFGGGGECAVIHSYSVLVTSLMNLSHADPLHTLSLNPWLRTCLHKVFLHNH